MEKFIPLHPEIDLCRQIMFIESYLHREPFEVVGYEDILVIHYLLPKLRELEKNGEMVRK